MPGFPAAWAEPCNSGHGCLLGLRRTWPATPGTVRVGPMQAQPWSYETPQTDAADFLSSGLGVT